MKKPRFFFTEFLIAMPLLAVVAIGVVFFLHELPRLEATEKARVEAKYREIAETIKDGEAKNVRAMSAGNAKSLGRLGRGTWGINHGKHELSDKLVWYRPPKSEEILALSVEAIPERDIALVYGATGAAVFAFFLVVTNAGLRRWRRFLAEREDFMAASAHDLTTPLAALEFIIGRDDAEAKRIVGQMQFLVRNIREFLRAGGRRPKPKMEKLDLVQAVKEAYASFAPDYRDCFDGKDVAIIHEGPVEASADRTLLAQILWNLFANDLKYAAPYGSVEVRVSGGQKGASVKFVDYGPGMEKRDLKRAFNRYYRAKSATKSGKGGFGIGLCNAREAARAMGGELSVSRNRPSGCVFELVLV